MDYRTFFGLREHPFRLTPDPDFFFPSDTHREALQTLIFSVRSGEGFVQITGLPGTGKTLLLRTILRELKTSVSIALILNPRLSPDELLRVILEDLGHDPSDMTDMPKEVLLRSFRDFLLEKAGNKVKTIVIVDEAQNLPVETLEELRLLSNLETDKEKLLQIILVGQLELEEKLNRQELVQLTQRITIRYRLENLSAGDTRSYIYHRLRVAAGGEGRENIHFNAGVLRQIHALTRGTPRLINSICERALMAAYVEGKKTVERRHVKKAFNSISGHEEHTGYKHRIKPALAGAAALLAVGIVCAGAFRFFTDIPDRVFQKERGRVLSGTSDTRPLPDAVPSSAQPSRIVLTQDKPDTVMQPSPEPTPHLRYEPENPAVSAQQKAVNATSPQQKARAQPLPQQAPLTAVLNLPEGKMFLSVDLADGTISSWKGTDNTAVLVSRSSANWRFGEGLFILCKDRSNRVFVFDHAAFLTGAPYKNPADELAPFLRADPDAVIPVVACSTQLPVSSAAVSKASAIKDLVGVWSETWKRMDTGALITFYGDLFTAYYVENDKPLVYTRRMLYDKKNAVMRMSGFVDLVLSDPLCVVNPVNTRMAVALFNQHYASNIYAEEGMKVLYFSLVRAPDGTESWKIVGKLWARGGREDGI